MSRPQGNELYLLKYLPEEQKSAGILSRDRILVNTIFTGYFYIANASIGKCNVCTSLYPANGWGTATPSPQWPAHLGTAGEQTDAFDPRTLP